jgi:hypothetical protein
LQSITLQYFTLSQKPSQAQAQTNHTMPDEFDVRDDREEAREEGGDDEVGLTAIKLAAFIPQSLRLLHPGMN